VAGTGSLILDDCAETNFAQFRLLGNSAQGENPTLENRQEIKSAGRKSRNLFNISKLKSGMIPPENINIEESTITLPAGGAIYFNAIKDTCPDLKVGDEIYIFADTTSTNKYVYLYPESGLSTLGNKITVKSLDDKLLLYSDTKINTVTNLMITKLNDKTYEPYTDKKLIDVNVLGRNLVDIDALKNENGYMSGAYEKSRDIDHFNIVKGKRYLLITKGKPLVAGDYSSVYFGDETLKYGVNHYDVLGTATGYTSFTSDLKQNRAILTAKKTATITKMILHGKANTRKDDYDVEEFGLFEILEDNTNIDYEPYKEPQTVRLQLEKPLTKWDRLEKREGVWGIARQSVREELTQYNFDTYILPSGSYPTGVYCYATKKSNAVLENQSSFCTHFKNSNYAYSITNAKVGIYSDHGRVPYKYFVSDKPTVDEFKAWLVQQKEAGTPVELVYKTAEETWEPLPEETQLALENLHTNDGTTIITVDSGEVETGIEVEYAIKN
jgi:hypothetical protein